MGSRSHPHRVLSVCVCVCVSRCLWGVCDWGWFAPAESHHRWAISVPVMLSPLSDPCSVCGRRLRSVLVPGSAIPEPCFPGLDSWALLLPGLRSPDLGCPLLPCATRLCPTESSASALWKAPPLPTESSAIHFVFWLFLSINLSSCNWILQALVCDNNKSHYQWWFNLKISLLISKYYYCYTLFSNY